LLFVAPSDRPTTIGGAYRFSKSGSFAMFTAIRRA
jgi:hypothetical protein